MSHDTHQHTAPKGPKTPLGSAFWLVLVLVVLFVSAVNFVNVMGHDEGHHEGAKHEAVESHEATHEGHATEAAPAAEHHEEAPAKEEGRH